MKQENRLSEEKVREVFNHIVDHLADYRRIPVATYRLQFNRHFRFSDAMLIVSYLHDLGISDCYSSPYFKAQEGSLHGYNILDHNQLNPEVGTEEEYDQFVGELQKHGMGQILDIVPNHMGIASPENLWWMDVLENGPSSVYSDFFDIDWKPVKDELENKVLLPILGDQYGRVLENQELILRFEEGSFFISYHDRKLPVAPLSYLQILKHRIEGLEKMTGPEHPHLQELLSILTAVEHLPSRTEKDRDRVVERRREKEIVKRRLADLYSKSGEIRAFIDENVHLFNGDRESPRSFDLLDRLLSDQAYRLSHWRVATEEINYRRFFDINELAAIRMEHPQVFQETHRLVFKLIRERKVTALRVDHPDGLYDPAEYFAQLQRGCFIQYCSRMASLTRDESTWEDKIGRLYDEALAQNPSLLLRMPLYIVGEKILTKAERMPEDWPIFSTTGYVFMNSVNGILVEMNNAKAFDDIYSRVIKSRVDFQDLVYEKKKLLMLTSMPSEINTLGHYLNRISERNRHTRDFTLNSLTTAIVEVIANFPVYRTYVTAVGVNDRDLRYVEQAVSRAKRRNPALSATIFDFLQNVLLLSYPKDFSEDDQREWLDFTMRFQQLTGPIMAKGVEDTAFYVFNRFVSLNEVGGNPERFGTPLETFHGQNIERTKYWPCAMITTSTHDTKRGEDVRARLNVLSEIPEEWRQSVMRWRRLNKKHKSMVEGHPVPDANEEYLLYQTLVGTCPLDSIGMGNDEGFKNRIKQYMIKAVREAKTNTSWISPNTVYEEAILKFVNGILAPGENKMFLRDLEGLASRVSHFGMFNSVSQTLLKMTCPGIPDFYQGTELWDFSLVDPDNRRPVDYEARRSMLEALKGKMTLAGKDQTGFTRDLMLEWKDGSIKLFVIFRSLQYRRENSLLFQEGNYIPLAGDGTLNKHVCAYARRREGKTILVIVPRFVMTLLRNREGPPLGETTWGDSFIVLPGEIEGERFRNLFTHELVNTEIHNGNRVLPLKRIFAHFCVSLLEMLGEV
jgi:(1->4)-alpha-D-glucan 1-alpha-D-glucosylmutase